MKFLNQLDQTKEGAMSRLAASRTNKGLSVKRAAHVVPPVQPRPNVSPRAWVLCEWLNSTSGEPCQPGPSAAAVVAVCVNEALSTDVKRRLMLMCDVADKYRNIAAVAPSVWLFPAGFFGFDAARFARDRNDPKCWPGLGDDGIATIIAGIKTNVLPRLPDQAVLVVG